MKVLLTGAGGQLGAELLATAPPHVALTGYTSAELDVCRAEAVRAAAERERPALIIHAAAYTAVDAAEQEPERAGAVNTSGAAHVATAARAVGARMIHISTDFVFDGGQGSPYRLADSPNPLGVYGRTKLEGEREVARISAGSALILRTAWLYSSRGRNFVLTMLGLMGRRDEVRVVSDQVGTPTWGQGLARAIWTAAGRPELRGIHHWTDAGVASWYDFAVAIQEEALACGLLDRAVPVRPLRSDEYPTAARRPPYSVLDKTATWAAFGMPVHHWRHHLRLMLRELAKR